MKKTQNDKSRIIVKNGEVKTVLSDKILEDGYMSVEEAKQLTLEAIKKIYELNGDL
jgi:polyhydroxyalkanoate synthesis regulator phasin